MRERIRQTYNKFVAMAGKYKYVVTIVIGVLIVGFIGENSILQQVKNRRHISRLESQIEQLRELYLADSTRLNDLYTNPDAIEKIARERYFMKSDDEDIFVLSDDNIDELTR